MGVFWFMKIQIDSINFVPVRPTGDMLIGFAGVQIGGWLELNSIGVHKNPDGSVWITPPARKLKNNILKRYFMFLDVEVKEQLRKGIEEYIDGLGYYSAKTSVDDVEFLNYEQKNNNTAT